MAGDKWDFKGPCSRTTEPLVCLPPSSMKPRCDLASGLSHHIGTRATYHCVLHVPFQVTLGPVSRQNLAVGPQLVARPHLGELVFGLCASGNLLSYSLEVRPPAPAAGTHP